MAFSLCTDCERIYFAAERDREWWSHSAPLQIARIYSACDPTKTEESTPNSRAHAPHRIHSWPLPAKTKKEMDWNRKRQSGRRTPYFVAKTKCHTADLGALPVHDGGPALIVLLLFDPHLLERGQRGQDGPSDPDRVLPLGRGDDFDGHRVGRQRLDLLLDALRDPLVHRGAAAHHHVAVQILPDVDVALHDGREGEFVDALLFEPEELRLEQRLRSAEPLGPDGDHLAVGQFVILLELARGLCFFHFRVVIERHVAQLLFDVAHDLFLRGGGEGIAPLREYLLQILRDVPSRQIQPLHGVRQTVPFVNGHSVSHSVARIQHDPRGPPRSVQREHRLDRHVESRRIERLEHDLRHFLAVRLGIQRRLGQQNRVLLGGDSQLVIKGVVPHFFHVVPVVDDPVLHRVFQRENASLRLGLVANVAVLLPHPHHHSLVAGPPHNRREHGAGSIVPREPRLHHSRAVVDDTGRGFFVHGGWKTLLLLLLLLLLVMLRRRATLRTN